MSGCVGYLEAAGFAALARDADEVESLAYSLILEAAGVAARHPVGTVLRMAFDRDREKWQYRPATESSDQAGVAR